MRPKHKLTLIEEAAIQAIHNVANNRIVHLTHNYVTFTSCTRWRHTQNKSQLRSHSFTAQRQGGCCNYIDMSCLDVWPARCSARDWLRAAPGRWEGARRRGCVRSESASHVLNTRPFLTGRVSFLKAPGDASIRLGATFLCNLVYMHCC